MNTKNDVSEAVFFLVIKPLRTALSEAMSFGMEEKELRTLVAYALDGAIKDREEEVERYEQGH